MAAVADILGRRFAGHWQECGETFASIVWSEDNPPDPVPTEEQFFALEPGVDAEIEDERQRAEQAAALQRALGPDAVLWLAEEIAVMFRRLILQLAVLRTRLDGAAISQVGDWSELEAAQSHGQELLQRLTAIRDRIGS